MFSSYVVVRARTFFLHAVNMPLYVYSMISMAEPHEPPAPLQEDFDILFSIVLEKTRLTSLSTQISVFNPPWRHNGALSKI